MKLKFVVYNETEIDMLTPLLHVDRGGMVVKSSGTLWNFITDMELYRTVRISHFA